MEGMVLLNSKQRVDCTGDGDGKQPSQVTRQGKMVDEDGKVESVGARFSDD
jgi:hypothetical protein